MKVAVLDINGKDTGRKATKDKELTNRKKELRFLEVHVRLKSKKGQVLREQEVLSQEFLKVVVVYLDQGQEVIASNLIKA